MFVLTLGVQNLLATKGYKGCNIVRTEELIVDSSSVFRMDLSLQFNPSLVLKQNLQP